MDARRRTGMFVNGLGPLCIRHYHEQISEKATHKRWPLQTKIDVRILLPKEADCVLCPRPTERTTGGS